MIQTRRSERLAVLLIASVVLLLAIFFWARWKFSLDPPPLIRPVAVLTRLPLKADLAQILAVPAMLETDRLLSVVPRVGGLLIDVVAEEGDEVSEGTLLARVDPEPYNLELRANESAWILAESSLVRMVEIHKNSGISQQQLDEAQATRDAAFSAYEISKLRQSYTEIRAPMEGLVLARFAELGALTSIGTPLFFIGDAKNLRIKVRIPEKYWDDFRQPSAIRVRVSHPREEEERIEEMVIIRVGASISRETKTFDVVCAFLDKTYPWPVGTRLRVAFTLEKRDNVWSLPLKAMTGEGDLWWMDMETSAVHRLQSNKGFRDALRVEIPEQWFDRHFIVEGHQGLIENQVVIQKLEDL